MFIPNFGAIGNLVTGLFGRTPETKQPDHQVLVIAVEASDEDPGLTAVLCELQSKGLWLDSPSWLWHHTPNISFRGDVMIFNGPMLTVELRSIGRQVNPKAARAFMMFFTGVTLDADFECLPGPHCAGKYFQLVNREWAEVVPTA